MFCKRSVPQQDFWIKFGAGEGIRTLDFNLGKVAEYPKTMTFLKEAIPFFVEKMKQY